MSEPGPGDSAAAARGDDWSAPSRPAGPRATVHRQPLVRADGAVRGYAFHVTVRAPLLGTSPVDVDAVVHEEYDRLDLATLTGGAAAFVRATAPMLTGEHPLPPAPSGLVLVVPPAVAARPDADQHLRRLRGERVGLALADLGPDEGADALLGLVDFVTIDLARGPATVAEAARRAHAAGLALIAEHVDTEAGVRLCTQHGVDLMQGPMFPRDTTARPRELSAGQVQCLELMHLLSTDPVDQDAVVRMIRSDPELSMRVLRLVNLSAFAVRREIDSVQQAVVLVGPQHLATLAMTSLLDSRTSAPGTLWFTLTRALACRTLARHDGAYTVGLLSAVAARLRMDPAELVRRTGVSADVGDALADRAGPWGPALAAVLAHEADDPAGVAASGVDPDAVSDAYLGAVSATFATAMALAGAV